jgi:hypothetical protein
LKVLLNKGGCCFQKDNNTETGLSKIKTRRIVVRPGEQWTMVVNKVGETDEVSIPRWLRRGKS